MSKTMNKSVLALACLVPLFTGCTAFQDHGATVAGTAGTIMTAQELSYTAPEFIAGGLIAYAIYDPLQPTWSIEASVTGEDRVQMDLQMKRLVTGGEGEARQVFMRT
ncbi:MAG: hypothetical protein CVU28_06545, partial [Betaproteobacteria bacterium HGW-Betaproteobacteria-21]